MPAQDFLNLKQAILATLEQGRLPAAHSGLRQGAREAAMDECRTLVAGYLQKRAFEVLRFMQPRYPEPQHSLDDLGFDSMLAMELRHQIETELEVDVPAEVFIGTSTLAQVAGCLLDQLVLTGVIQSGPVSSGPNDDSEEIIL